MRARPACKVFFKLSRGRSLQLYKETHQFRQLIIRIQAARVWQNPDTCFVNSFGLLSDLRLWFCERMPVRAHSEDRHDLRTITLHFCSQGPATRDEIFFG